MLSPVCRQAGNASLRLSKITLAGSVNFPKKSKPRISKSIHDNRASFSGAVRQRCADPGAQSRARPSARSSGAEAPAEAERVSTSDYGRSAGPLVFLRLWIWYFCVRLWGVTSLIVWIVKFEVVQASPQFFRLRSCANILRENGFLFFDFLVNYSKLSRV